MISCRCDGRWEQLTPRAWVRCRRCVWLAVLRRPLVALALLALTACTPLQVHDYAATEGIDLSWDEAEAVAEWIDTDCLPDWDGPVVVECAVRDAAHQYGLPVATFARLIDCESRFDPAAVNARSGATGPAQFLASTWEWVDSMGAPWTHLGRDDPRANVFTAAWLISRDDLGGVGHWSPSAGCHGWTP